MSMNDFIQDYLSDKEKGLKALITFFLNMQCSMKQNNIPEIYMEKGDLGILYMGSLTKFPVPHLPAQAIRSPGIPAHVLVIDQGNVDIVRRLVGFWHVSEDPPQIPADKK